MFFRAFFKNRFALLLGCFFFAFHAQAAVTVDNNVSSNGVFSAAGVGNLTFAHQTNVGLNRALIVGVSTATTTLPGGAPVDRVATVTYNGTALTRIGTAVSPAPFLSTSEIFILVNPPVGSFSVVITFAAVGGNPFVNYAVGGAVSLQGVSQGASNVAFFDFSGTNDTPTATVTGGVVGDLVLDTLATLPSAVFVNPGQTFQYNGRAFFSNSFDIGAGSTKAANLGTTTTNWTMSNSSDWALGAVLIRQSVATAATVSISGRVMLPSGRGVARAQVILTDSTGQTRTARTNFLGFYRFEKINAGETYVFNVASKSFAFAPQTFTINEDFSALNLVVR